MLHRRFCHAVFASVVLAFAPLMGRGADVLQQVPSDALGFVVVHHLSAVDGKVQSLSSELRNKNFSPLEFLKSVAHVQDGLNIDGDLLLVIYPYANVNAEPSKPKFAVWLPVTDYARFAKSIGATSLTGVAAGTIGGEDLLVTHVGDWAVLVDPDERDRIIGFMVSETSGSHPFDGWRKWINENDVTAVALAPGVKDLLSWAEGGNESQPSDQSSDDLFGPTPAPSQRNALAAAGAHRAPLGGMAAALDELRKWTAASPAIARSLEQVNMIGCGVRFEAAKPIGHNARASLRVAFNEPVESDSNDAKLAVPFSMYDGGGFVISGAGRLPKPVAVALAAARLQQIADELKTEEHTELDDETLQQLNRELELAAGDVRSFAVLTQPGAKPQPVYSNDFVALRVTSARGFVNHAEEVMRLWNKANRDADGETKLIYDVEATKVGSRVAMQYSLDVTAILGTAPVLPEVRQAMERLFGPGGKMRVWIVRVDDNTVLVALATQQQVEATLKLFDRKQAINWNRDATKECNGLLPADADWRLFFDPHRYVDWEQRLATATIGVPIIGGPLVRTFRDSPPIGIAGRFQNRELRLDAVALAPTIKSAFDFVVIPKRRLEVRRRLQPAPR
ncbi:MAG TPA: hypothetical protein VFW73_07845 [Lacipirellulaceae bacterium]|nr:hypothetical protein [Lacipirellulaceae bacterium]